jgi:hypothetical protein
MLGTMQAQSGVGRFDVTSRERERIESVGPGDPGSLPRKERKSKEGVRQAGLATRFGLNWNKLELDFNSASQFRRAVAQ